ncbi:MAG: TolC family protein, partial [Bacteroidales bacterium]|nr:TolC family protein [Bacteroidales bacterium]
MKINMRIFWICFLCFIVYSASLHSQELTLDHCRSMALKHNKASLISEETLQAAISTRKAAFTQFLPNFNAMGTYMHNTRGDEMSVLSEDATLPVGSLDANGKFTYNLDPTKGDVDVYTNAMGKPIDRNGNITSNLNEMIPKHVAYLPKDALTFDMSDIFVAGIGFTQPIFMGGKIVELYKMSKAAENIARIKNDNDNINVLIQVDEAFWRVVSLQKKRELAQEYNNLLQKTYNDVEQLYNEGVVTNAELLK